MVVDKVKSPKVEVAGDSMDVAYTDLCITCTCQCVSPSIRLASSKVLLSVAPLTCSKRVSLVQCSTAEGDRGVGRGKKVWWVRSLTGNGINQLEASPGREKEESG